MNIKEIDQLISDFKQHRPPDSVYMNPNNFEALWYSIDNLNPIPNDYILSFNDINIYQDPDIEPGIYFICHPRLFEIWKSLKGNCWLQTAEDRITAARILYEAEQQQKERGNRPETIL